MFMLMVAIHLPTLHDFNSPSPEHSQVANGSQVLWIAGGGVLVGFILLIFLFITKKPA
jgi:hypothetical protein